MISPLSSKKKGFTLIEILVAVALFAIIMMAITDIFGSAFGAYRNTRNLQRNLQSAQFAMNLMAKELRTSSVVSASSNNIVFIDYSQNRCIRYRITGGDLTRGVSIPSGSSPNALRTNCQDNPPNTGSILVSNIAAGAFAATPSTRNPSRSVGKVTVALRVGSSVNNRVIQSSVSLRDYHYTEL